MTARRAPLLIAGLVWWLTGCQMMSETPYRQALPDSVYGYSEERIDDVTWRVRFAGNSATSRETVENYVLFRAAEIAQDAGAEGFATLQEEIERDVRYRGTGYVPFMHSYRRRFHPRDRLGFDYGYPYGYVHLRADKRYTGIARIRLYRGRPTADLGPTYDAAEIMRTLGPRIVRPAPAPGAPPVGPAY